MSGGQHLSSDEKVIVAAVVLRFVTFVAAEGVERVKIDVHPSLPAFDNFATSVDPIDRTLTISACTDEEARALGGLLRPYLQRVDVEAGEAIDSTAVERSNLPQLSRPDCIDGTDENGDYIGRR